MFARDRKGGRGRGGRLSARRFRISDFGGRSCMLQLRANASSTALERI